MASEPAPSAPVPLPIKCVTRLGDMDKWKRSEAYDTIVSFILTLNEKVRGVRREDAGPTSKARDRARARARRFAHLTRHAAADGCRGRRVGRTQAATLIVDALKRMRAVIAATPPIQQPMRCAALRCRGPVVLCGPDGARDPPAQVRQQGLPHVARESGPGACAPRLLPACAPRSRPRPRQVLTELHRELEALSPAAKGSGDALMVYAMESFGNTQRIDYGTGTTASPAGCAVYAKAALTRRVRVSQATS